MRRATADLPRSSKEAIEQPRLDHGHFGFATVRAEGTRRLYAVDARPLAEIDAWLGQFRRFWGARLDALATEIARGKRARRTRR
jgi:hypothetical protein